MSTFQKYDASSESICSGDTWIIKNVLDEESEPKLFEKLQEEISWKNMTHHGGVVPRLVAIQGDIANDGSTPIYRFPADEMIPVLPFSPTIEHIRKQVEKKIGHQVNHVLIQYYRNGMDYISEHSDKTLDIVPDTFIGNLSLGSQRTMVFRSKSSNGRNLPRLSYRAPLPHTSLCKMGLLTNMHWLHGIKQDKRLTNEKSPEELAYNCERISLTFRMIGTFLSGDKKKIWGQGATGKSRDEAHDVVHSSSTDSEKILHAFAMENLLNDFNWDAHYGSGFDIVHISRCMIS